MRVKLLTDLLLTSNEVGRKGESHTVSKDLGLHLVREGFATELTDDDKPAPVRPEDPAARKTKPLATTHKTK